jgi:hypothetical protein
LLEEETSACCRSGIIHSGCCSRCVDVDGKSDMNTILLGSHAFN